MNLKCLQHQYRKYPEFNGIGEAVLEYLSQKGQRYSYLDKSKADPHNHDFLDKPVWHNKRDLDEFVADKLGIHPDKYGARNKHQNPFYNAVVNVISCLRNDELLIDLSENAPNTEKGIWRLNDSITPKQIETELADEEMNNRNFHCSGELVTIFARQKQERFRKILLEQYDGCLFCKFDLNRWMVGAHIVPYHIMRKDDPCNSMNPCNGLLLCKMCDVAFEYGHIRVEDDYGITITDYLSEQRKHTVRSWLSSIGTEMRIHKDVKHKPNPEYLKRKKQIILSQA